MTKVTVVVVTYNGEPWIRRNLRSLSESTVPTHVVIVDNASTDNTVEIVQREFPQCEIVARKSNAGFGIGNNVGIARAMTLASQYTLLLNQDAYVTPTTIAELVDFLDTHASFGVASPVHCSPDLDHIDRKTYRGYLQSYAADFLCDAALNKMAPYYRIRGINAAAWLVRTSIFGKTGGFDPIFFMYGEDDDLMSRFVHHDVPFAIVTGSRVVHLRAPPAPSTTHSVWVELTIAARRARSTLIALIKRANYSAFHMALQLTVHGMLKPFSEFLVERNAIEFFSTVLAALRVMSEIPRIRRHARRCATAGAHFLTSEDLREYG